MTVTRSIDFEGTTDNATLTVAGIIAAVTGTPQTRSDAAMHGTRGLGFAAAATTSDFGRIDRGAQPANGSVSFYWTPDSIAGAATTIYRCADSTNAVIGQLRYRQSDNKWDVGNGDQSVNFVSTQTFTMGHQYRINIKRDFTSALNPIFTVEIFDPSETDASQAPYASFGGTIPTALTWARELIGRVGTSASTRLCHFDDIKIADGFLEVIQAVDPLPVFDTIDTQVGTSDNDGSWNKLGTLSKTGSSLLVGDPSPSDYDRSLYARFPGIAISKNSDITTPANTYLTLTGLGLDSPAPNPIRIYGILQPNPTVPANNTDIRSRPRTLNYVDWVHTTNAGGTPYNSPDMSAIVQELVDQTAWTSGNAMMFTVEDTVNSDVDGALSFYSYDNDPTKAPSFHVEYDAAPPITDPTLLLMMGGNSNDDGFTVSCKSINSTTAAVEASVNADMSSSVTGSTVAPGSNGWAKPVITGLDPLTQYYYRIKLNGVRQTNLEGEIQTMPTPGVATNFTFISTSCANTNSNHRIFDSLRTAQGAYGKPLFFLHNGDFHYVYSSGGSAPNVQATRRQEFEDVLNNAPRQHELYRKLAFYYGNSDVDGCGSNCDGTYPGWPAFGAAYREVMPHPTLPDSGGSAVYFAFPVGRCLIIRTDHRRYSSAKAAVDDASKTNLGAEQEAWLITQLTDPIYPIKIWIHENKWVGAPVTDGNTDNWQTYSTVRQRIADVITSNSIKVYYIHGDSHSFAADNGNYNPYGGFPYVVSAPMDKDAQVWTPPVTNGRYPDVALSSSQGYGIFDVKDTGSAVTITFAGKTIYPDVPPPPIGAHSFNEPSGAVVDDTGNGHGFTLAAGLSRPAGKFGTGLTSSVSTVDGPPVAYGETPARTLMMWLKSTATFNGGVYQWHDNVSGLGRWGLKCNFADMIGFEATDSAGTAQFASIPRPTDGLWHHYAGAWDSTLVRLYKDGVLQSPQTAPAITLATLGTSRTGGCAQVRVFTDTGSPTLIDYFQVQEGVGSVTLNPPAGILPGDKVIIWSSNKLAAAIPTDPEPWNFLGMGVVGGGADGVGTGPMRIGVWEKIITDPLGDILIDVPGAINVMGSGVVYRPPAGVAWQPSLLLFGTDNSAGTGFSAQVSDVGGYAVGDYCLSIGVLDDEDPLLGRGVQMPGVSGFGSGINSSGSSIGNHMFMFTDHLQVTAQALSGGIAADADLIRVFSDLSAGQTIDDVRVYDLALDTNTIQTLMNTPGATPPAPAMAPRVAMGYTWSTLAGATIRVADGVGGTVAASFKGVIDADGTTILPATLKGWWDGSVIRPLV